MVASFLTRAGSYAAVSTSATWDAANKGSGITLSGSNLIATKTAAGSGYQSVRSTTTKSSGQYYVEFPSITWSTDGYTGVGLVTGTFPITGTSWSGADLDGVSLYVGSVGEVYLNNAVLTGSGIGAHTSGQSVDIAVDFDTDTIGFRINNGSWVDRSFSTMNAGPYYLSATTYDGSSVSVVQMITASGSWARSPRASHGEWT